MGGALVCAEGAHVCDGHLQRNPIPGAVSICWIHLCANLLFIAGAPDSR